MINLVKYNRHEVQQERCLIWTKKSHILILYDYQEGNNKLENK